MKNFIFRQLVYLSLVINTAYAASDPNLRWSVTGFGTLGFASTDTNQLGFYRDRSQMEDVTQSGGMTTDSRLGLQLDGDISNRIHMTTQFVARDHGGDFLEQNLEWAFLRWSPSKDLDFSLGRLGLHIFALSDHRNVGYAYPWMRPPHEYYANLPYYHYDGFDITKKFTVNDALMYLKLCGGYTYNQIPSGQAKSSLVNLQSPAIGLHFGFEVGNWRSRIGYSYLRLISDINTDPITVYTNNALVNKLIPNIKDVIPKISLKNTNLHFISADTNYDDGTWLIQAEAAYTKTQTILFPSTFSSYLSIGRRIEKFTFYTLYGFAYSFDEHLNIPKPIIQQPALLELTQAIDQIANRNGIHEQSVSLGLRWDVFPKVALKAEWNHYWFGSNGTRLWQEYSSTNIPDQTNVWSMGVDFMF